jgi:hypothetical protein
VKVCGRCKIPKSLDQFNKATRAKDGVQPWCRSCTKAVNNELYRNGQRSVQVREANARTIARNINYVSAYLLAHPCVDCGEADVVVLEFDHVRGGKDRNICDLARDGVSLKRLQDEIDKCEVRCANDHRRRTVERRQAGRLLVA